MWIKTISGALLNANLAETIMFDEEDNLTKACIGNYCCVIAEGNVIPAIATAIRKQTDYLGVL